MVFGVFYNADPDVSELGTTVFSGLDSSSFSCLTALAGASSKRRNRAGDGEYPRHAPGFQGMPFQSLTIKNNAS